MNNRINRNAVPPLTFLFSLLPGAGHMYLGLMRRGLELMFAFFACIFLVADALRLSEIGVPLAVVIFAYSLFDALHLNRAIAKGEEVTDACFLKISKISLNGYHAGIGIIIIGVLFLINRLSGSLIQLLGSPLYYALQRSVAPILMMSIGIYLVLKSRKPLTK